MHCGVHWHWFNCSTLNHLRSFICCSMLDDGNPSSKNKVPIVEIFLQKGVQLRFFEGVQYHVLDLVRQFNFSPSSRFTIRYNTLEVSLLNRTWSTLNMKQTISFLLSLSESIYRLWYRSKHIFKLKSSVKPLQASFSNSRIARS